MSDLVHTKLVAEIKPAKFLSLGFGNIARSEADLVCISAFNDSYFTPNSAIGAVDRALGKGVLAKLLDEAGRDQHCTLLDVSGHRLRFRRLLVIWMGTWEEFIKGTDAETMIQSGLQKALRLIAGSPDAPQVDITAVGTQYGGLHRRRAFDVVVSWALDLFKVCGRVNHLRLVAYDLDTFVDFFEALHRLKNWAGSELVFGEAVDWSRFGAFRSDVTAAAKILDQNPKQVLVICRTVVESVTRRLCENKLGRRSGLLFEDIRELQVAGFLPDHINSYLHTCRVLGNDANHAEFHPSRRDAEAVMLLTLRVVEWFLNESGGQPAGFAR